MKMRTFDLIKKKNFKNSTLLASTTSERKDLEKKHVLFVAIITKTNAQPPISSLFQDSEKTSTSTETNNTTYESPNIQLFGARRIRAWQYHGGATPTSHKTVCYFPLRS
jgi:hypothetical protein